MHSLGVIPIGPLGVSLEIEIPGIIWACNKTVPASDAPVVIHNDYTIITLVRSFYGADLDAWWMFTVIT